MEDEVVSDNCFYINIQIWFCSRKSFSATTEHRSEPTAGASVRCPHSNSPTVLYSGNQRSLESMIADD